MGALVETITTTLRDLGVDVQSILSGIKAWWDSTWLSFSTVIQPVTDAIAALKTGIEEFQAWVTSVSIPNPFAGWQVPSLPALPNPFGGNPAPGQNAVGTQAWRGGLTWVGERGPELLDVPFGTRIYNNRESMALAGSPVTVNVAATVSQPHDVELLARRVARMIQQKRGQ